MTFALLFLFLPRSQSDYFFSKSTGTIRQTRRSHRSYKYKNCERGNPSERCGSAVCLVNCMRLHGAGAGAARVANRGRTARLERSSLRLHFCCLHWTFPIHVYVARTYEANTNSSARRMLLLPKSHSTCRNVGRLDDVVLPCRWRGANKQIVVLSERVCEQLVGHFCE